MTTLAQNEFIRLDRVADTLEALAKDGCPIAVTALRKLLEYQALVHAYSDGLVFEGPMLDIVEPLVAELEAWVTGR